MRYEPHVIESRILSGQLEIAFNTIPMHSEIYKDFSYIILEHAEYVLVATNNHPKVNEDTVLSDFDGEQAIYWNMDNSADIICRKNFNSAWFDTGINVIPSIQCTLLSTAYTELLLGNAVMLCNAKNEICAFPEIRKFFLPKRDYFGCVWSRKAPPEIQEFAEDFRKYEVLRN